MPSPDRWRWIAVTIFVFSSVLNYLDRQILATMVEVWRAKPEFPFSDANYGDTIAVFSIAYALSAPFMGWFLDRVGLNRGISITVALWSLTSLATGFVHSFHELLLVRGALGIVEASGISAVGKMGGMYLRPKERAMGSAMSQLGLSIGAGAAPAMAIFFAYRYNWRWAFYVAGILGLLWIPLWLFTSKLIPPGEKPLRASNNDTAAMLRDRRLWAMIAANFLSMSFYSLWTNWTPRYLSRMHHLTAQAGAPYNTAVQMCGYAGALLGAWLSWQFVNRGRTPAESRKRVCLLAASIVMFSAAIPLLPTPLLATIGISLSFFWISAWSTNLYTLPVDLYGANGAAFGVSGLVFAYGAMQAFVSRPIGVVIDRIGFQPVCFTFALLPLASYFLLLRHVREQPRPSWGP